jgi:hypothetical protein
MCQPINTFLAFVLFHSFPSPSKPLKASLIYTVFTGEIEHGSTFPVLASSRPADESMKMLPPSLLTESINFLQQARPSSGVHVARTEAANITLYDEGSYAIANGIRHFLCVAGLREIENNAFHRFAVSSITIIHFAGVTAAVVCKIALIREIFFGICSITTLLKSILR